MAQVYCIVVLEGVCARVLPRMHRVHHAYILPGVDIGGSQDLDYRQKAISGKAALHKMLQSGIFQEEFFATSPQGMPASPPLVDVVVDSRKQMSTLLPVD